MDAKALPPTKPPVSLNLSYDEASKLRALAVHSLNDGPYWLDMLAGDLIAVLRAAGVDEAERP